MASSYTEVLVAMQEEVESAFLPISVCHSSVFYVLPHVGTDTHREGYICTYAFEHAKAFVIFEMLCMSRGHGCVYPIESLPTL